MMSTTTMPKLIPHALTALAAALALGGCSLIPTLEKPAAPIAAQYPAAPEGANVPAPTTDVPAADLEWQAFFTDARLKRLIEIALANNRDLRVAMLNVEQMRAQYDVKRADQWPTINAAVTGSREPGSNGTISSVYTAGIGITSYELDLWGRVRALKEAALAQYFATEEARKTAQITLISSVASTYLAMRADDELLALTKETLRTREESLKLTQLTYDSGAASALDLRLAQSLVAAAQVSYAQTQRQRMQDENALTLLLGQPVPADLPAAGEVTLAEVSAGLPSELLARRPDVRQAEQALIAANANIGAARAAYFPRITLTGTFGIASTQLSKLFSDGERAWTFAPVASMPLFDGGRNSANLDAAKVGRDIALAQYEKSIQSAFREVADALAGRATYGDQARAAQALAEAEGERFKLSDLRYRNGAASYLDLLDAQRSLFSAQQSAIQAKLALAQNQVTMYKVLGGGWKEPAAGETAAK